MIDPWEVVMIGAIIAALLVWGPKKIPDLAKSLGEAKHELEAASRGEYKRDTREIPDQQQFTSNKEILEK